MGVGFACGLAAQEPVSQPNIIFILADDLGYGDVGYNPRGEPDIVTPNLDRIAANGAALTAGYAMNMVCGPSRAALATGRYQQRFGYHDNVGPRVRESGMPRGLPLEMDTIADYFSDAGYSTGLIGKYHDGDDADYWPYNRGFQTFYGFNDGAVDYWVGNKNDQVESWYAIHREDGKRVPNFDEYLTDAFGQESLRFIEANKDEPFFLMLSYNAPHDPMMATEEDLAKFAHIENEDRRIAVAMIYNMDKNIGLLLDKLEAEELMEETLIIFTSDNGGAGAPKYSGNAPLFGHKGTTTEGGIRVPTIVQWSGTIPAGQVLDEPVNGIDLTATMLHAGTEPKAEWQLEGVDLMPYLTGEQKQLEDRYLFWDNISHYAVRDRDWKYLDTRVRLVQGERKATPFSGLFRISDDISEQNDLSKEHPEELARLKAAFEAWRADNEAPRFGWGTHIGPFEGYRPKHEEIYQKMLEREANRKK
ncbi:hypothetical protein GCM10023333_11020 [Ferrimonas pelagia]|uniref:Sulfatase N-terminal domain-containing protein n=2 Tax=Ferrimonas pelagia TaxID=1177826 RepID=A0ABP9ERC0_9GAMM